MTASAQGRDYSAYQSPLTAADLEGLNFCFTKVTNGLTEIDPNMAGNWSVLGRWAGARGGYHEFVGGESATGQAAYFVAALRAHGGLKPGDMLAVVASDYPGVTDADVLAWCDEVRSLAGPHCPILVYTDLSVAQGLVATSEHYDLWVAWPSDTAPGPSQWAPAKWGTWRLWQWGTEGGVDADAFNGTAAGLGSWISTYTGWTFPEPGGLHIVKQTREGYSLAWDAVSGPSGQKPASYSVFTYDEAGTVVNHQAVTGLAASEYGPTGKGLPAGTYQTHVWADDAPLGPPHATVQVTLSRLRQEVILSAPVEAKVKASTTAAAVAGLAMWALGRYVFKGTVPDVVASWVYAIVPALVTFAAGYLAKHTDRPVVPPAPVPAPPAAPPA